MQQVGTLSIIQVIQINIYPFYRNPSSKGQSSLILKKIKNLRPRFNKCELLFAGLRLVRVYRLNTRRDLLLLNQVNKPELTTTSDNQP